MKNTFLITTVLIVAILSACSSEKSKIEKIEFGNGIYINSGRDSDSWVQISSGYRKSADCETNEFYIESLKNCVIAIDTDSQIRSGLVLHRQLISEVEGKKFYRLLISKPDGSLIEKG
jgi:hypothetical protein